jgi:CheY-like chemotaxis protein
MKKELVTVVLADDDEDDREFILEALIDLKINYKLITVVDGAELMNLLTSRGSNQITEDEPDFVLLDINMPKVDGITALRQIKQNEKLRNIPIYILSTSNKPEFLKKAHDLGVTRYYKKSGSYQELKDLLLEICSEYLIPTKKGQ